MHPDYKHIRTWRQDGFRLDLWDTHRVTGDGRPVVAYTLRDARDTPQETLVFAGEDFYPAPGQAIESDQAVAGLLSFLSLQPGDTDDEYFANYTTSQLTWCSERAEELGYCGVELEES